MNTNITDCIRDAEMAAKRSGNPQYVVEVWKNVPCYEDGVEGYEFFSDENNINPDVHSVFVVVLPNGNKMWN